MTERVIPAQAVEAAARALRVVECGDSPCATIWEISERTTYLTLAHAALTAATPFIRAQALEDAAQEFHDRLPDGTGNGRAYNSHQVARILRDRAGNQA